MESDRVIVSQRITLTDLNDSRPSSLLLQSNQSKIQTYDVNNNQYQPDYTQNQIEITPRLFFGNEEASDKIGQQIFYYLNNNSEAVAKVGGSDAPSEAIYQQDSKLIIKLNIGQGILTGTILQIKAVIPEGVLQDTLTGEYNKQLTASLEFARLDSGVDGAQGMTIQKVEQQYIITNKKDQAPDKTDSGWSTSQGNWEKGKYLWIRTAITYYNPATKETTVEYTDPYCDSSWEAAADGIMTLEERIDNADKLIAQLEKEVDGAIETWFMKGDPNKLANYPWFDENASVQDDPKNHEGDLYFDTVSGKSYRFFKQSEEIYSWQIITDTELTQAMADIQNLQTQVDSKVKIFYDKTAPDLSKAQLDDLWVKPDGNFYQCVGTKNADGSISNKRWDVANVSIDSVTVEYAEHTSNTIAPETGWTTTSPSWSADKYVWQRTVTTFKDGAKDTHRTDPVCISAAAARGIVIAGEQVFQSTDGTNYVPSAITLTASCMGGTTVGKWYYKDKNGSWVDTNVTNSSISISSTHAAFNGGTTATIKVNAAEGDYYDIISLYKVTDGKKGVNGEPASSVFLTNENITFAGNANGQVAAKTVVSNLVAYTGTTKKTPVIRTITGAPSGMIVTYGTAVNNEIPITISVAANAELGGKTEQAGTIIIEISSPVVTSLVINWSKVNTGATGEQGIPGKPGINVEIKSADGRVIFTDNEASDIVLQAILRVGGVPQTGNVTYSWTSMPAGITGTSNTLVIKRADVPSARSFACVIGYDGETYTGVIGIEDKTDTVYCNIKSSNGDKFTDGNISTTLTCRVYTNKQGQVDTNGDTYIYSWKKYHLVDGIMVQDTSWGIKIGKTQNLDYKDVTDKIIFSCEIKKNGSKEPIIAYDEITLQILTNGSNFIKLQTDIHTVDYSTWVNDYMKRDTITWNRCTNTDVKVGDTGSLAGKITDRGNVDCVFIGTITEVGALSNGQRDITMIPNNFIAGINGRLFYGTCNTAAETTEKEVSLVGGEDFQLMAGSTISIKFTHKNSASSPTLKVTGLKAKNIRIYGQNLTDPAYYWTAGATVSFTFDGSYWNFAEGSTLAPNFMSFIDGEGLYIGNKTEGIWKGYRTLIKNDSFNILNSSGATVASYGANDIKLGVENDNAKIGLCNDKMTMAYGVLDAEYGAGFGAGAPTSKLISTDRMSLIAPDGIGLFTKGKVSGGDYECSIKMAPQSSDGTVKAIELTVIQTAGGESSPKDSKIAINMADIKATTSTFEIVKRSGVSNSGNLKVNGGAIFIDTITAGIANFTGLVSANNGLATTSFRSNNATIGGTLLINIDSSGTAYIKRTANGEIRLQTSGNVVGFSGNNGTSYYYADGTTFRPGRQALENLGHSSFRWDTIYSSNSLNSTSDRKVKKDIFEINDKYIALFNKLIPVTYKLTYPTSDRTHIGFISQDVEQSMYEVGLTDMDFGGFCRDIALEEIVEIDVETGEEKTVKREKIDEEGNPIYNYSLRYGEFVALNTKIIQLNQQRIETLEEEIKQLKLRLSKFENSLNL